MVKMMTTVRIFFLSAILGMSAVAAAPQLMEFSTTDDAQERALLRHSRREELIQDCCNQMYAELLGSMDVCGAEDHLVNCVVSTFVKTKPMENQIRAAVKTGMKDLLGIHCDRKQAPPLVDSYQTATPTYDSYKGRTAPYGSYKRRIAPYDTYKRMTAAYGSYKRRIAPYDFYKRRTAPYRFYKTATETYDSYKRRTAPYGFYQTATPPYDSYKRRTAPYGFYQTATPPYDSYKRRTAPYGFYQTATPPYDSYKRRTAPYGFYQTATETYESFKRRTAPYVSYETVTAPYGNKSDETSGVKPPNCDHQKNVCKSYLRIDYNRSSDVCGSAWRYADCLEIACETTSDFHTSRKAWMYYAQIYLDIATDQFQDCEANGAISTQSCEMSAALFLVMLATLRNFFSGF